MLRTTFHSDLPNPALTPGALFDRIKAITGITMGVTEKIAKGESGK